jgi:chromosome segregation ATPase
LTISDPGTSFEICSLSLIGNMRPRSRSGRDYQLRSQRAEIDDLRQELIALKIRMQEKDNTIHQERQKVANLNVEVLRVKLAADREARLNTNTNMMHLRSVLSEAERERDWYKQGFEQFRERLKKSKAMNAALLDFMSQVLVDGVYPECEWEALKMKQEA